MFSKLAQKQNASRSGGWRITASSGTPLSTVLPVSSPEVSVSAVVRSVVALSAVGGPAAVARLLRCCSVL